MTNNLVLLPDADMPRETVYTRQGFPLEDERNRARYSPQRDDKAPIGSLVGCPAHALNRKYGVNL